MINLEKLFDNSIHARNFERLAQAVMDTGADPTTGAPRSVSTRFGTVTLTWAGGTQQSNAPSVAHGLSVAPVVVFLTPMGGLSAGSAFAVPVVGNGTITSTVFQPTAKTHDLSSPTAGVTTTLFWVAIG